MTNVDQQGTEGKPSPWRRRIHIGCAVVAAVVLAVFGFGAWALYRGASASLEAENKLHGVILVGDLVAEFCEKSDPPAWPRSWSDLESLPAREYGGFVWPRDAARVKGLVQVDFAATLAVVRNQEPESFTAIQPTAGPQYPMYMHYAAIIDRLRRGYK